LPRFCDCMVDGRTKQRLNAWQNGVHVLYTIYTNNICAISHWHGTRADFHQPSANLTKYQKGVYNLGVNVF
jgi:hypothetical protein